MSYHLKMLYSIFNRLYLLFRAPRLFTIGRLGLIIVFPFDDTMFLFHLCDIKISHAISVLFLYPVPYGVIGSSLLEPVRVHVLQTELHTDLLALDISLGKQTNSLDMHSMREHIATADLYHPVTAIDKCFKVVSETCGLA